MHDICVIFWPTTTWNWNFTLICKLRRQNYNPKFDSFLFILFSYFINQSYVFLTMFFFYCQGSAIPERYFRPVCFPMAMCWLFGTLSYLLPLVFDSLYVVLPVFIMFTFYRSFLFAIGIAFVTEAWVWIYCTFKSLMKSMKSDQYIFLIFNFRQSL